MSYCIISNYNKPLKERFFNTKAQTSICYPTQTCLTTQTRLTLFLKISGLLFFYHWAIFSDKKQILTKLTLPIQTYVLRTH